MKSLFFVFFLLASHIGMASQELEDKDYAQKRKLIEYELKKKAELSKMKSELALKKGRSVELNKEE